MPFVPRHIRLTNSGRLPDIFLTAKVQGPSELADARLGKLYFVLQIDVPWNHVFSIGSSIINVVSREYYRQEGTVPLESFESAIAKANRLIDQLIRDGETRLVDNIHAIIGLAVADELHIAYTGEAEAYFLRNDTLNLITEPGKQKAEHGQVFANMITGEISEGDVVVLGSPGLYGAITTDDLELLLKQPLADAALNLAKRLKSLRIKKANAILIRFDTLKQVENATLAIPSDTLYLDQQLESTFHVVGYYLNKIWAPASKGMRVVGGHTARLAHSSGRILAERAKTARKQVKFPKVSLPSLPVSSANSSPASIAVPPSEPPNPDAAPSKIENSKLIEEKSGLSVSKLTNSLKLPQLAKLSLPNLPVLPRLPAGLPKVSEAIEAGVPIHHYLSQSRSSAKLIKYLHFPVQILRNLGKQFRIAIRRSPRTWYIIIALILLSSIGASIQTQRDRSAKHPAVAAARLEETKKLVEDAKQAKVYGNSSKARELYLDALAKAEEAKTNPKLTAEATSLYGTIQRELLTLSSATELTPTKPLVTLPEETTIGTVFEGVLYYTTQQGELKRLLLTGADAERLATLPNAQAVHQLAFDAATKSLYLQDYQGQLYHYSLNKEKLSPLTSTDGETIPVATGLGTFGNTLYLLDPAGNQILKYGEIDSSNDLTASSYTKSKKVDLSSSIGMAIDGSVFVLSKDGVVTKFVRGNPSDFKLTNLPVPFDNISRPISFTANEDSPIYYYADQGSDKIPPRIIEFDKNGKFSHQYFLPKKWQNDIKLIVTNPKSHKAWVIVNKELYEFTLVQ